MNAKELLYVGFLLVLTGCAGMTGNSEPSHNKEQTLKYVEKNQSVVDDHHFTKGINTTRTKRMMAWIELSKD